MGRSRDVPSYEFPSCLTPAVSDTSRKVYRCNEAQRQLRNGRSALLWALSPLIFFALLKCRGGLGPRRYASFLKPALCAPLIELTLDNGQDVNAMMTTRWAPADPFVTRTDVRPPPLSVRVGRRFTEMALIRSCASKSAGITKTSTRIATRTAVTRRPKSIALSRLLLPRFPPDVVLHPLSRQQPQFDGLGDRITSLTLRAGCWLFLRETARHANCFAVHLEPGDVYTMVRGRPACAVALPMLTRLCCCLARRSRAVMRGGSGSTPFCWTTHPPTFTSVG